MADLIVTGTSGYATGSIDSATVLVSNVSTISARHPNGIAAGVVQIETILGSGTALKGSQANLVDRLAVAVGAGGQLVLSDPTRLTGALTVPNGGTAYASLTPNRVLFGNAAGIPFLTAGMAYQGPTSIGSGSTQIYGGASTVSGSQSISGIHFYTSFNQTSGTISCATGAQRIIICASDSITISGTITTGQGGSSGGAGGTGGGAGSAGANGYTQPGAGGGAGSAGVAGGAGGLAAMHAVITANGGAGGSGAGVSGSNGTSLTGDSMAMDFWGVMGGAGGGGGGASGGANGGVGGRGGASIVLIAPTVTLAAGSALTTSGSNGADSGGAGGNGGGGAAGNVYIFCRSFIDAGCTFTQAGGTSPVNGAGGGRGGTGANGIKQILIYG